jgi:hypothetical protein
LKPENIAHDIVWGILEAKLPVLKKEVEWLLGG